jgi:hypothetical protein
MKRNFIARTAEEAQQVFGTTFYAESRPETQPELDERVQLGAFLRTYALSVSVSAVFDGGLFKITDAFPCLLNLGWRKLDFSLSCCSSRKGRRRFSKAWEGSETWPGQFPAMLGRCGISRFRCHREKWTPFFGPRNAEIKLGLQVLLGLCFVAA